MRLKLIDKKLETGDVWSFFFEPAESLTWIAGQSIRLEIPRKTWGVDERRFTIASAPHEGHLRITTRLSKSEFKQNLQALEQGAEINGYNIEGDFIWEDSDQHKVFLAAGIGITPFRALLAGASTNGQPLDVSLIYQSKDTPPVFLDEFEQWAEQDKSLTVFITPERIKPPKNPSRTAWLKSLIYISGPEAMVQSIAKQLLEAGLPPGQLKTDLFTGIA